MQVRKIGIISKGNKESIELAKQLFKWIEKKGYDVIVLENCANKIGIKGYKPSEFVTCSDVVLVLGGDGTMLSAARLVAEKEIPILGINLGGLGFITEVNKKEVFSAIEIMLKGECLIEERIMLQAGILRNKEQISKYTVLNDAVITKGALARIIDLETYVEHTYVTTFKADGLIISTPTGSTAYNLSAGGPILHCSLECIIITPICPHTLTNRPIVIPGESSIEIILKSESEDVFLTLDGQIAISIKKDDVVEIKKSPYKTRLLVPYKRDYFQILREKMNWGKR